MGRPVQLVDLLRRAGPPGDGSRPEVFKRSLQTLYARLNDLHLVLRPTSGGAVTSFALGVLRRLRWGVTAHNLPALFGGRTRGRGRETQRANRQAPQVSIGTSNPAPLRDRAAATVKLQDEVPHAGPANTRDFSPDPAPHGSSRRLSSPRRAGFALRVGSFLLIQRALQEVVAVAVRAVVVEPEARQVPVRRHMVSEDPGPDPPASTFKQRSAVGSGHWSLSQMTDRRLSSATTDNEE
jgi:hypothetical protein